MCGFLVYREKGDNSAIASRGPDQTNRVEIGGLTFVHNLLAVTGRPTPQPFIDLESGVVCVYNGEIYNRPWTKSDGEALIPLYLERDQEFARDLDGEFAIALYDFRRGIAVFATDPFGSKPLFVKGVECASYRSGIGGERLGPNRIRVVRLRDGGTIRDEELHRWDFAHQTEESYDPWIATFERAVAKRAVPGCFLGLSSGYDSGAIACALLRLGVPFKVYSFLGSEDRRVLDDRLKLVPESQLFKPSPLVRAYLAWLYGDADNEKYAIHYDGIETKMRLLDDGGVYGVATYSMLARDEGRKVSLSGQGADEILSDYALFPGQSELKGRFPAKLLKWRNFDRGCQESYLVKEEYAAGAFGIEARYPFLDRAVVQAFLHLSPEAKNRHYKAPLRAYLERHGFPYRQGVKIGFSVSNG